MVNCTAIIYKDTDTLDSGQRVHGEASSTTLWQGPAYFSAPSRTWEQAAALEGIITGTLYIHTTVNLNPATRITVSGGSSPGDYQVAAAAASGNGWRLTLKRRP